MCKSLCIIASALLFCLPSNSIFAQQQRSITTVSATPTTADVGKPVIITATVAGSTNTIPVPTGTVSVLDGTTSLDSVSLLGTAVSSPKTVSFSSFFGALDTTSQGSTLWADLNGDGKSDLLSYGSTFQVFLNNGSGSFTALSSQSYQLVNYPYGPPVLIDFNSDGKLDILAISSAAAIQVFYGNGDGTFQPPAQAPGITVPPPSNPQETDRAMSLAVADVSGSGRPAVLLGVGTSLPLGSPGVLSPAYIVVFRNDGSGVFTSIGSFPAADSPAEAQSITQILLNDFNNDDKPDIVVGAQNNLGPQIFAYVLLNNGDGTFAAPTKVYSLPSPGYCPHGCSIYFAFGDFANRGKSDLAVLTNIPQSSGITIASNLAIYPGNGDGSFATPVTISAAANAYRIVAEDIDGDGRLDLVDSLGYAYLGRGSFTLTTGISIPQTDVKNNASLMNGDLDGDGLPDLLFSYPSTPPIVQFGSRTATALLPALTSLAAGTHTITASYPGDANFSASTSSPVTVTINKFAATVIGSSAPNPVLSTQGVQLSAQVTSSGSSAPTGTVTFTQGSTTLSSAPLTSGKASILYTFNSVGTHNIQINYSGDASNAPATASIQTVTVANFPSTTTFTTTPNPVLTGQNASVNLVVSPTGTSPTPTGTVAFVNGTTQLGTASLDSTGKATFITSFASAGNQTITANYLGDAANQPSSAFNVVAVLTSFNVQPSGGSTTLSITKSSSVSSPLTVNAQNGFGGTVSFSCSGLPAGATCSFNPAMANFSGTTTATVTLTVATASTVGAKDLPKRNSGSSIFFASTFFTFLVLRSAPRPRRLPNLVPIFLLCASALYLSGCGGNSSSSKTPSSYNFNVIASSGTAQQTTPFTLNVQ
jgi:hypothetical protein